MGVFEQFPYANFHELNLDWMIQTMKEIKDDIEILNEWKLTRDERDAEIDRQLADLNARFIILEDLYNTFVEDVNKRFTDLSTEITTQVNDLESRVTKQVNELEDEIYKQLRDTQRDLQNQMDAFKLDVNALLSVYNIRIQSIEDGLQDVINRLPEMFTIVDPYTGVENSIVNVIYEIVNKTKVNALTAGAYDAKNLTAQAYDDLQLSAYNYDFNGSEYIN